MTLWRDVVPLPFLLDFDRDVAKWKVLLSCGHTAQVETPGGFVLTPPKRVPCEDCLRKVPWPADQKVLRIQTAYVDGKQQGSGAWIERYFLRDRRGVYRELKKIPGRNQYAPGEDEILEWFASMGVTHVQVAHGWHESVPSKIYPLKVFARHMRRVSKEQGE